MVPRRKVAALDAKRPFEESAERILQSGFPVFQSNEGEIDRIVGVLSVKDLARAIIKGDQPDVKALMRVPYFVPDSKPANVLLQEMQKERVHLAVLIDEYGGFSGIVTTEDLTEESLAIYGMKTTIPFRILSRSQTAAYWFQAE